MRHKALLASLLLISSFLGGVPAATASSLKEIAPLDSEPGAVFWSHSQLYLSHRGADQILHWDRHQLNVMASVSGCQPQAILQLKSGSFLLACTQAPRLLVLNALGQLSETFPRPVEEMGLMGRTPKETQDYDLNGITAMVEDQRGGVYLALKGDSKLKSGSQSHAGIYYLAPSRSFLMPVVTGLEDPSGLALSADQQNLYFSEGRQHKVFRYHVNQGQLAATGSAPELVMQVDGQPGPLALNSRGHIYIALEGAGSILVANLEGRKLAELKVPLPYITGFSYGQTDRTLYIAAAESNRPSAAGALYEMQL